MPEYPSLRIPMTVPGAWHELGQSIWLDTSRAKCSTTATRRRYIDDLSSPNRLTSNPTIFDEAIGNTSAYDSGILRRRRRAWPVRNSSSNWRWEDLRRAADLFRPVFATVLQDRRLCLHGGLPPPRKTTARHDRCCIAHSQTGEPADLFVKFPGTPAECPPSKARSPPACRQVTPCSPRRTYPLVVGGRLPARHRAPHIAAASIRA